MHKYKTQKENSDSVNVVFEKVFLSKAKSSEHIAFNFRELTQTYQKPTQQYCLPVFYAADFNFVDTTISIARPVKICN